MDTDQESLALIALRLEKEFALYELFTVDNIEELGYDKKQSYQIIDAMIRRGIASIHVFDKNFKKATIIYIRTDPGTQWVPMSRGVYTAMEKRRARRVQPQTRYRIPADFNAVIHSRLKAARTWLSVDQILHNDLIGDDDKKSVDVIRKKATAYLEYLFEVGDAEFSDDKWRFAR